MKLTKASTNEEILAVLNQTADAISVVLTSNTDWGLSGLRHTQYSVDVDCDNAALAILHDAGCAVLSEESQRTGEWGDNEILVVGIEAAQIGHIALREQVELHELTPVGNDLEALFLELTAGGNPGGAA